MRHQHWSGSSKRFNQHAPAGNIRCINATKRLRFSSLFVARVEAAAVAAIDEAYFWSTTHAEAEPRCRFRWRERGRGRARASDGEGVREGERQTERRKDDDNDDDGADNDEEEEEEEEEEPAVAGKQEQPKERVSN